MITAEYCRMLARNNQLQNNGLRKVMKVMDEDALRLDRGAFAKSVPVILNCMLPAERVGSAGQAPQATDLVFMAEI